MNKESSFGWWKFQLDQDLLIWRKDSMLKWDQNPHDFKGWVGIANLGSHLRKEFWPKPMGVTVRVLRPSCRMGNVLLGCGFNLKNPMGSIWVVLQAVLMVWRIRHAAIQGVIDENWTLCSATLYPASQWSSFFLHSAGSVKGYRTWWAKLLKVISDDTFLTRFNSKKIEF